MSEGADRLARTRLAILEHVQRKDQQRHPVRAEKARAQAQDQAAHADVAGAGAFGAEGAPNRSGPSGHWAHAKDLVASWLRYHPAHMAVDLVRPMLSDYGARKPVTYLGIAAVAGAGLLLMRPWKLISVTGVLVALVKSPQVAALVMSALSSSQNPRDDEPVRE